MRLLNCRDWIMHDFISEDDTPRYAILSHTWGGEELTYQQWESSFSDPMIRAKSGYKKIKDFGRIAAQAGFEWIWVDTCCIDKKSSAELSEAINSMFQWYLRSAVCYVYLADVTYDPTYDPNKSLQVSGFHNSRWFTRGWTLQELIAPEDVEFFDADWRNIASKYGLEAMLSAITGIDEAVLRKHARLPLGQVSVARRMSWASKRKTSRLEDGAYCLLGIFDVNLPLIYGEGRKAFRRLQEAIMGTTHDQSLFAWGRFVDTFSHSIRDEHVKGYKSIPWKPPEQREPLVGLFAESPSDFSSSADIEPVDNAYAHDLNRKKPPAVVNGGVLLNLVILKKLPAATYWDDLEVAQPDEIELAILLCREGASGSTLVGIALHAWGDGYCSRTREMCRVDQFVSHIRFESWTVPRHLVAHRPYQLTHGDILIWRWETSLKAAGVQRPITKSGPAWRHKWRDKVLRLEQDANGDEELVSFFETGPEEGIAVILQRKRNASGETLDPLTVGFCRVKSAGEHIDNRLVMTHWVPKDGFSSWREPEVSKTMEPRAANVWKTALPGPLRVHVRVTRLPLGWSLDLVDVIDISLLRFTDGISEGEERPLAMLGGAG